MKKLFFFVLLSCFSLQLFSQFQHCNSPTTQELKDVYFIDANVGIVVGDSGIILRSGDGGNNWSIVLGIDSVDFSKVGFFDADHGIAVGTDLFQTTDGGFTWTQIPIANDLFIDIEILDANTCIISGETTALIKSTDQGATFTDLIGPNINESFGLLSFITPSIGYSCQRWTGNSNVTQKTTDGGISWQAIIDSLPPFNTTVMEAMEFTSEQVGFKGGWYYTYLQRSGNAALSWNTATSFDSIFNPQVLDFHIEANSPNAYYASGWHGEVFKSMDSGFTWEKLDLGIPPPDRLFGIYFINELTGWVVGDGGVILKTTNGGGLVAVEQPTSKLEEQTFFYPNPSNGIFYLETQDDGKTATITIFNALGQLVLELPAGSQRVDLQDQPAGLYWAAFSSGETVSWQRIIKQ